MTDRPFGANPAIMPAIDPVSYEEYLNVIVDAGIRNGRARLPALHVGGSARTFSRPWCQALVSPYPQAAELR
jgi:hypothetical protein